MTATPDGAVFPAGRIGGMSEPSVFSRILAGDIPGEILRETERLFVIKPLDPVAPVHLLVIPKTGEYRDVVQLASADPALLAEMVSLGSEVAAEYGDGDFRFIFNTGEKAGQTVFHVHAHVLSGGLTEGSLGDG